jgi:hypothetical protein
MKSAVRSFMLAASIFSLSAASSGQLTVDATGPIRHRIREASRGGGGSVGRKIPLRVALAVVGGWDDKGKIEVEFTLTNDGGSALTIPISPNPGDLEPADPKASYSVKRLTLFVTSDKRQANILPGQTHLYGEAAFPGTLAKLSPGESLRVLTLVGLPRPEGKERSGMVLVGQISLAEETVRTVGGETISEADEVGAAASPEYTLRSLLKPPD